MNQQTQTTRSALDYETRARRAPVAVPVSLCITLIVCGTALVLGPSFAAVAFRTDFWMARAILAPVTWLPMGLGLIMIVLGYWHARH